MTLNFFEKMKKRPLHEVSSSPIDRLADPSMISFGGQTSQAPSGKKGGKVAGWFTKGKALLEKLKSGANKAGGFLEKGEDILDVITGEESSPNSSSTPDKAVFMGLNIQTLVAIAGVGIAGLTFFMSNKKMK